MVFLWHLYSALEVIFFIYDTEIIYCFKLHYVIIVDF